MKRITLIFIVTFISVLSETAVFAEFIYLNDGQVLQGKIVSEDTKEIVVETKFQKRTIRRDDVLRIMYGERKMEKVFLLMNDGTLRNGFKVDEDATQIFMRDTEDSPKEYTIPKSQIKQISGNEIVLLSPSIAVRLGIFMPLNSKGAKLKAGPAVYAGSDITLQTLKNIRVLGEVGYSKCGSSHAGLYMQFIPAQACAYYNIPLSSSPLYLCPKISLGVTMIDFNDGEGSKTRSFAGHIGFGAGIVYEISKEHLYAGLWSDCVVMRDSSSTLYGVSATLGISYRF
jgi:hypothetical protein